MEINQPAAKFQDASIAPMHTVEHILNQTMVRMFACGRSRNAHIERKKSKCDYILPCEPTAEQIAEIENRVNDVIKQNMPVTIEFVTRENVPAEVDLSKLPADASETLRIVRVGDYDTCACIGTHVANTSEIGEFKIISHSWENNTLRLRFKDVLGTKSVPNNPNFHNGIVPHAWTYNGKAEWYGYHPNSRDYQKLAHAVSDYLEVFQEQTYTAGQKWQQTMR